MTFRRIAAIALATLVLSVPLATFAQSAPYSEVIITTEMTSGMSAPSVAPLVTLTATSPSMTGVINNNSSQISYASNFSNDTRTGYFVPGSVVATAPGYYFTYSQDCSGFTPLNGAVRGCTITISTTPPPSYNTCSTGWYGSTGCTAPVVPYQGPYGQTSLSCSPSYQTVGAGQPATFTAAGGTPGGYDWTTTDRTTLNAGNSYTTIFQTIGEQTVLVSNGVQTASCTVDVVAGSGAVTYVGSSTGGTTYLGSSIPSIVSSYIPAYLPNTGFGPQNGAVLALALVLLISAGIFFLPYVRKALTVVIG